MFGRKLRAENEKLRSRVNRLQTDNQRLKVALRNVRRIAQWDRRWNWMTNPVVVLTSIDVDTGDELRETFTQEEFQEMISAFIEKARGRVETLKPGADEVREAARTALKE